MDNQHKKITGYRDLSQAEIDLMNEIKQFEETAAEIVARVSALVGSSQQSRDVSLAKTHYEEATIRLVRAVAYPVSPWYPR
jgi:hypothetical protein